MPEALCRGATLNTGSPASIQIDLAAAPDIIRACRQAARLAREHEVRCGSSFFSATARASTGGAVNVSFALDEVLAGDEHGLTAVDAPGLVETAQIECVKADNVVDRGHGILDS